MACSSCNKKRTSSSKVKTQKVIVKVKNGNSKRSK